MPHGSVSIVQSDRRRGTIERGYAMERYYDRQRPVQARQTGGRRRRKKRRGGRTLLWTLAVGGVFTVALLIYLVFFSDRERTISMEATPISTAMTHLNTGRGLLYQTDGQLHYFDWADHKKNYTAGTTSSDIKMSGSSTMSAVYNASFLHVVGQDNAIPFTGSIDTVECGDNYLAVLRRDSEGSESVLVLTRRGEQIDQLLPGDQFIVDFGFYKTSAGEMLWVEMLSDTASQPTTTIRTYDLAKHAQTGAIQVQNQLVEDLYINTSSIFVSGTNQIIRYTHDGNKEAYRITVYGYRVLDFSSAGNPTFLLTPRGGDMHAVKLLQLSDTAVPAVTETYLQLQSEGVASFLMNGSLIVVSRDRMFTYTLKGKLSDTALFELPVDSAHKLSETMLLLESNGLYYTASIK